MRIRYPALSRLLLAAAIACAIFYINHLQFSYPSFYDPDSYFHIAVSRFIKDLGPRYQFHWAQFSTFKDSFADKDFLFHLFILPFLSLTNDPVLAGKYAFIALSSLFILAYAFILKRYLPHIWAALFLFIPFLSSTFTEYFLQLRSLTLANILTILGIYLLIRKRVWYLGILSLIYPLTHISFFTLIAFALLCETIRYLFSKEFFVKNIYIVLSGTAAGLLIHPNFPHNLFSLYINGFIVPLYAISGINLPFGTELAPLPNTGLALSANIAAFAILNIVAWIGLRGKQKIGFPSAVWAAVSNIYLFLALFSNRYWYQADILLSIFLASYARDCAEEEGWRKNLLGTSIVAVIFFVVTLSFFKTNTVEVKRFMQFSASRSSALEETGRWMEKNIPANETVYHSAWPDSPYFMCLNPRDDYLSVLDPLYMYYRYPRECALLNDLTLGRVAAPDVAIRRIFKARYGYVNTYESPLLAQINADPKKFKILHRNDAGVIFEIIDSNQKP